ncbi:hypothetical protein C1646_750678 [Rhizophagus diaphanus]|nr:hypothetical protein C1646_750678 [Rhizophagus diaphanus] [Rhizophagus sp. MUCL 43196]
MSDVYSVGVLLWEISSYRPPFYTEGESYDVSLVVEISQGHRETVVPNTPEEYSKLYIECWDGEPCNRPTINQVVERLKTILMKSIILKTISIAGNCFSLPEFEINFLIEEQFNKNELSKGAVPVTIAQEELFKWLLWHQNKPTYIFLLGYFYYLGIETNIIHNKSFDLFFDASKGSKEGYAMGQLKLGTIYDKGIPGIRKNSKKAANWYEKAADNGNNLAKYNLAFMYKDGTGVCRNYKKAFSLFKQSAENGDPDGMSMLGYCYNNGVGTPIDKMKAFESYQKAIKLGNISAQYNLAIMYEVIYWYKKVSEQGDRDADHRLKLLLEIKKEDEMILLLGIYSNYLCIIILFYFFIL